MKFNAYIIGKDGSIIVKNYYTYENPPQRLYLKYFGGTTTKAELFLVFSDSYASSLVFNIEEGFRGLSLAANSNELFLSIGGQEIDYNQQGSLVLYVNDNTPVSPSTFTIECYKNTADFNRVDKTEYLDFVRAYNGTLRESASITDPIITIQKSGVIDFNYIKIPIFNRYYYVADITSIATGIWEITFTIDVLMTYKNGLKEQKAFIDRNETYYGSKSDIIDKKRVIFSGVNIETITLENELFLELEDTYVIDPFTDRTFGGSVPYILSGYKIRTTQIPHGYVDGGI